MSLFEKYTDYDEKIKEELGIPSDVSILNMEYYKDTGQFNVTLKDNSTGKRLETKACVLPESVRLEIIELLWPVIYKNLKFNLSRSLIINEYSSKKGAAEKELESKKAEIDQQTTIMISELAASEGLENEKAELEAGLYFALQKTADSKAKAKSKAEVVKIIKKEEELKKAHFEKIENVDKKISLEKEESIKKIKEDQEAKIEAIALDILGPVEDWLSSEIEKARSFFELPTL